MSCSYIAQALGQRHTLKKDQFMNSCMADFDKHTLVDSTGGSPISLLHDILRPCIVTIKQGQLLKALTFCDPFCLWVLNWTPKPKIKIFVLVQRTDSAQMPSTQHMTTLGVKQADSIRTSQVRSTYLTAHTSLGVSLLLCLLHYLCIICGTFCLPSFSVSTGDLIFFFFLAQPSAGKISFVEVQISLPANPKVISIPLWLYALKALAAYL